jgi:hypothetical protein
VSKWCHAARICAIALLIGGSPLVHAESIMLGAQAFDLTQVQSGLVDGTLWSSVSSNVPGLHDCESARSVAFGRKSNHPAHERYDAARRYEECLSLLRGIVMSAAGIQAASVQASFLASEEQANNKKEETKGEADFMGVAFGVGFGVSYAEDDVISEAEIGADGKVRAVKTDTQQPRVILESHYYGWCRTSACNQGKRGFGPFFGIVAKDEKLISGFALGAMYGWKDSATGKSAGFSAGLGAVLDSGVKSLAKGFEEGRPPPASETEVKYEEKSRWSALLFFTRTF